MNVSQLLEDFIVSKNHPCLMAQTVFKNDHFIIKEYYENLGSPKHTRRLLKDLYLYLEKYDYSNPEPYTFIAAFPNQTEISEERFEELLWQEMQQLHVCDEKDWDRSVSANPQDPDFSFSVGGQAFYVVGMHPGSSRLARQAPVTLIAFNLHRQFEQLRKMHTYERVRDLIRQRDKQLQGHINPMLQDFGTSSEARQYSGRAVSKSWKCPFHAKS